MPQIAAENVCVDFPIPSAGAHSLRNAALFKATKIGGRMVEGTASVKLVRALDGVSFTLSDGDRVGLIGHNGAGKTTLIRALAGIYEPSVGTLHVTGNQIPMFDIGLGLDEEASGYENIYIRGLIMGLSAKEIARKREEIAEFSELGPYLDLPIRTYSAGMMLRLMFSIATSVEGDIVLMDEWIAVGDADFRRKAHERLQEITSRAGIMVLASHDLALVTDTCNLGLHLEGGRVRKFGPIEEVLAQMDGVSTPALASVPA